QLLDKAISYHDPKGNWNKLKARLYLSSTDTAGNERPFEIEMDNAKGYFAHITRKDGKEIVKGISDGKEFYSIEGKKELSEEDRKKYKLTPEGVKGAQSFYGYLYGLPMKLRDKGAIISDTVSTEIFNGKTYQTLKVTYEPGMGKEVWSFFFDHATSAMEAYKFMFTPKSDEGEYITLEETITVSDIKIPKVRKWYFVKGNKYLGTDNLIKAESLNKYRSHTAE
ncbi:MAG TPA: DUF6503 family protein, partial [Flavisolibacter sp.]|nr:DUF6503 family protein [Flavisolibacter sp.]